MIRSAARRPIGSSLGGGSGVDNFTAAQFLLSTGSELLWHGHAEAAREVLSRAAEELGQASPGPSLAETLGFLEHWDEVRSVAEHQLAIAPTHDRSPWIGHLGLAAARTGDREEALRRLAELQALEGHPSLVDFRAYQPVLERAEITAALGDCERAARLLIQAFEKGMGHQILHRRLGLSYCRYHPAYLRVAAPTG